MADVHMGILPQNRTSRFQRVASGFTAAFCRLVILILKFYRYAISPLLPPGCRYTPTCSVYAIEAIQQFGVLKGSILGLKRISRCHPFTPGGYDPLPAQSEKRYWFRSQTG
jgi:putative membrane protein insertion efficiency factor